MAVTKYSRFNPDELSDLDLDDLIQQLSDFLLQSGFQDLDGLYELGENTLTDLQEAILNALLEQGALSQEAVEKLLSGAEDFQHSELAQLLNRIIERMQEEGYIRVSPPNPDVTARGSLDTSQPEQVGETRGNVRFELTDKTVDFLGFKTLKDLLGALGKANFGQHDTRDLATGVEVAGISRAYEFGDVLNLDISRTLLSAVRRNGTGVPIELEQMDLHVHQSEYRSSCATVLMLDCSHSMILYGEDRFTPAKKVALALAHLIRTQYAGDSLSLVLFHDSAEEVPLSQLAGVRVGPFYTNTCEGLRLARRILSRQRKDMRQIIMITDGKPSALTLDDGRIYRNPFGLDPLIVDQTFKEVVACRRSGILVNTFMLARDYSLVGFVKKMTEIVHGKAYFTSPASLGQYVLMDYFNKKTRKIH
ncbi:MAG: VWA domain-containing protein [Acidobacteriota bacterium]